MEKPICVDKDGTPVFKGDEVTIVEPFDAIGIGSVCRVEKRYHESPYVCESKVVSAVGTYSWSSGNRFYLRKDTFVNISAVSPKIQEPDESQYDDLL